MGNGKVEDGTPELISLFRRPKTSSAINMASTLLRHPYVVRDTTARILDLHSRRNARYVRSAQLSTKARNLARYAYGARGATQWSALSIRPKSGFASRNGLFSPATLSTYPVHTAESAGE